MNFMTNFMTNFMMSPVALAITQDSIERVVSPITDISGILVGVLLGLVGSIGAIWCIVLGVKYAKAEDPQEHEKAKNALKNAIIGFVLIFVLLVMLEIGLDVFTHEFLESYNI